MREEKETFRGRGEGDGHKDGAKQRGVTPLKRGEEEDVSKPFDRPGREESGVGGG